QLGLCAVENHQIGTHPQDLLDVRVDEPAHSRPLLRFGWIPIVVPDRDHSIARAHGTEHLRRRWNDRDDAMRFGTKGRGLKAKGYQNEEPEALSPQPCSGRHRPLTSSHKKKGPPMIAVMIPTGISTGATTVRAMRSHTMRNVAPKSADAGSTSR